MLLAMLREASRSMLALGRAFVRVLTSLLVHIVPRQMMDPCLDVPLWNENSDPFSSRADWVPGQRELIVQGLLSLLDRERIRIGHGEKSDRQVMRPCSLGPNFRWVLLSYPLLR